MPELLVTVHICKIKKDKSAATRSEIPKVNIPKMGGVYSAIVANVITTMKGDKRPDMNTPVSTSGSSAKDSINREIYESSAIRSAVKTAITKKLSDKPDKPAKPKSSR